MTFTSAYDILTCFELASPRHHHIECTLDNGYTENSSGRGGRDHTLKQRTVPSDTVFILVIDSHT